MSLFNKVFTESKPVADESLDSYHDTFASSYEEASVAEMEDAAAVADNPFTAYVKDVIRFGAPQTPDPEPEVDHYEEDWSDEPESYSYYEDEDDEPEIEETLDTSFEEDEDPPVSSTALTERRQETPGVLQASSTEQRGDIQVEKIVDGLFDRMKVVWGEDERRKREQAAPLVRRPKKQPPAPTAPPQTYALTESKAEISKLIRREIPQAMKGEMVSLLRTEIMKAVRGEIVRVVRDEFESLNRLMTKNLDRLHAIEARMAKIEGAMDREVKVNFPEGAVQIDAPITIPEREVKVAAPINVQPPHLTLDEGAITVNFNKTGGGKKEVRFERDPHDNCVKSAEIIDVSGK